MSTLVELKYGYDRASNRMFRRDEVAQSHSALFDELYGYDGLHRLTAMDRGELNGGNTALDDGPSLTQDWTLDPTGNWLGFDQGIADPLEQTRQHNAVNEITDIDKAFGAFWPIPDYDGNGNTVSFPDPRSLPSSLTATYDAWNRLVKLEDGGGTVAEYQYDGLNRRIAKTIDSAVRHAYFSDRWQVLEERVDSSDDAERQFVWGERYVDDLVLRDRTSERLYALQDELFNVVALTDDTGDVKQRFAYQPYGLSEPLDPDFDTYSGTDYEWEYRFTGRELDLESGLQINRNRYLHLELGRWLTWDPMGYTGSGTNLYEYVQGNAVARMDPSGEKCRIAARCNEFWWHGILFLGHHCGFVAEDDSGSWSWDGGPTQAGCLVINVTRPPRTDGSTGQLVDFPDATCDCLKKEAERWNSLPCYTYDPDGTNSNFALKCATTKCGVSLNWNSPNWNQDPPIGWNAKRCKRRATIPSFPRPTGCCVEWEDIPCP